MNEGKGNGLISLDQIRSGRSAYVKAFKDSSYRKKLMALGFFPGSEIFVQQCCRGLPIIVRSHGAVIAISAEQASSILVHE